MAVQDKAFRDAVPQWRSPDELNDAGRKRSGSVQENGAPMLMKGNEAVVHGALLAGCRCFFGYPN